MKRANKILDTLMADVSGDLINKLITESVEELEQQIVDKDLEIATLNEKLIASNNIISDLRVQLAEEETECENMKQYQLDCVRLQAKLDAAMQEEVTETQDEPEQRVTGVEVIRGGDGLTRSLRLVYA
jgi:hypothetical protein